METVEFDRLLNMYRKQWNEESKKLFAETDENKKQRDKIEYWYSNHPEQLEDYNSLINEAKEYESELNYKRKELDRIYHMLDKYHKERYNYS